MIAAFRLKPISRVVLLCLFITSLAIAQTNMSSHPKADAEKIADALRADVGRGAYTAVSSVSVDPKMDAESTAIHAAVGS